MAKVRELVMAAIKAERKIGAWIVDDPGFASKGVRTVGLARQYCKRLGKTDNCHLTVTFSFAKPTASLQIA